MKTSKINKNIRKTNNNLLFSPSIISSVLICTIYPAFPNKLLKGMTVSRIYILVLKVKPFNLPHQLNTVCTQMWLLYEKQCTTYYGIWQPCPPFVYCSHPAYFNSIVTSSVMVLHKFPIVMSPYCSLVLDDTWCSYSICRSWFLWYSGELCFDSDLSWISHRFVLVTIRFSTSENFFFNPILLSLYIEDFQSVFNDS